jgi:hypothetical protein
MTRTYKDNFTLDGRLKVVPGVTKAKVANIAELLTKHQAGNRMATATLTEALTTSDAIFNLAHLATINFLPNYDDVPRQWSNIAGTREVPDFKPVTLFSLNTSWTDGDGVSSVLNSVADHGVAPIIPEGTNYPTAYIHGDTVQGASVVKRGFKTDWTLEAQINGDLNVIDSLPTEMLRVSLDTEEYDVFGALLTQVGATSRLDGGVTPTGATVPVNAPLSRDALIQALIEQGQRKLNNRYAVVSGGNNLLVAPGQGIFANFILNQTFATAQDGSIVLNMNYNPLTSITVIESQFVTGTNWYLIPKKGSTRRPVIERLSLRAYGTPQLFVENRTGNYLGGAVVSPFEGSFVNDCITLKLRQFGGAVVWDDGISIVYSTGAGV